MRQVLLQISWRTRPTFYASATSGPSSSHPTPASSSKATSDLSANFSLTCLDCHVRATRSATVHSACVPKQGTTCSIVKLARPGPLVAVAGAGGALRPGPALRQSHILLGGFHCCLKSLGTGLVSLSRFPSRTLFSSYTNFSPSYFPPTSLQTSIWHSLHI